MPLFDFEMMTWNVRGLRDNKKRNKVFSWIKKHTNSNALVMLQETHSLLKDESLWRNEYGSDIVYSHGTNDSRGTMILLGKGLEYKFKDKSKQIICDSNGRYVILDIEIQDTPFVIINVYAPNDEHNQFLF